MSRLGRNFGEWAKKVGLAGLEGMAGEVAGSKPVQNKLENKLLGFVEKYKGWLIGAAAFLTAAVIIAVGSALSTARSATRFNRKR